MIIVIADDITGASEMGGIALRYNLSVVITDNIHEAPKADVLSIYTNTRSLEKEAAIGIMENLTAMAKLLKPSLFYKKTDSVLRGYVLGELKAQMKILNLDKALLVPVNPSLGRVIKDGLYYVNGEPIHATSFRLDPEFPITSSRVKEIIESEGEIVNIATIDESIAPKGITVGEAASNEDIARWASIQDGSIFLAGGASFFNALLATKYQVRKEIRRAQTQLSFPLLFVSGTKYRETVERITAHSSIVSYMPFEIFSASENETISYDNWVTDVTEILTKKGKCIIAIDNFKNKKGNPDVLRERISEVVKRIFEKISIGELLVEGGSVAYSIVTRLGWQSFIPIEELEQGIVRMQVSGRDTCLTIKPGSYGWPAVWDFS